MLFSAMKKAIRFSVVLIRLTGRMTVGVRGILLTKNDYVVSLIVPEKENCIITVTENGFGKRTLNSEYPAKSRATQGVKSMHAASCSKVVGAV